MAKVAFLGLGVMGYPMAGHLKNKGGHDLTVYNRTAAKAEQWVAPASAGAAHRPPRRRPKARTSSCAASATTTTCARSRSEPTAPSTGMKKGAVFVDHTTASAEIARELYAEAKKRGFEFVDAPVSGGQAGAENGVLTVMCGGEPEPYGRAEKVIAAYARMCKLLGPAGAGQLTKMVNQICIAGLVQGLSEGIHFAKKAGLDVDAVIETISKGAAQSWQMENRYKTMAAGKFDFGFAVDWMRKDLVHLPGRSAQERRQPAGERTGRPVLRGSAENGRPPLGHIEPDRTAGAVSESIKLSKLDHRAVLRNERAGSPDLVEMGEHERIHMGQHDPPCTQIRQSRLENLPGQVARHVTGIAVALDDEKVGPVSDRQQILDPFRVARIGEKRLAVE